ncbi:MAG: hypothetical protein IJ529_00175 [Alphaproteobacteria bacterium]|nr:hypothetical protein [Alphaproteobacteria bacterium]MBQ9235123.1 hypothetical protein [Alphaproteobacteria bacterium]
MVGKIMPDYIQIRQGDNFTIALQFRDYQSGKFIDLTNASLKMQVRVKSSGKAVLSKTGLIDDAVMGKAHLALLPADSKNLSLDEDYVADIQITFANGEVHTVYPADVTKVAAFIVTANVTE